MNNSWYVKFPNRRRNAWLLITESPSSFRYASRCLDCCDNLDINLSDYIVDPKTTENTTVTLMAYIGSAYGKQHIPNTTHVHPHQLVSLASKTAIQQQHHLRFKDAANNPDMYSDGGMLS